MPGEAAPSNERRRALASGLAQLALRDTVVPAMLAKAGPPLSTFTDWQDAQDKMTENVQRLLAFVEAQGCVDVLESVLRLAPSNGAVPAGPVAPRPRAEDVAITQALKDELVAVLTQFSTESDALRHTALSAFGNAKVINRVAWHKSIEEVAFRLVEEADVEGTVHQLVTGLYREKPTNRATAAFVKAYFPMLYQDPIERLDMDPITAAILAVLPTLASEMGKFGCKDAYEGLKAVIRRKWGDAAPISKAISAIEEDPNSKAQAATLEEKVAAVNATDDAEVAQALHKLVEQMKTHGISGEGVARIRFNMSGGVVQGVAGAENVQIGSMTFGAPPKD